VWNGRCSTARISESPNPEKGCTLSDILIKDAEEKYFLSPKQQAHLLYKSCPGAQGERIYSTKGISCTLAAQTGGFGGKTGLYEVGLPIKEKHEKKAIKMAYPGDSISLAFAGLNTRRGRVGRKIAHTLTTNSDQGTLEARAVLTPERETVRQNGRRIKSAEEPMFTLT
ncbi:DNA modification methyltransferase, partial [human gut metagenome]